MQNEAESAMSELIREIKRLDNAVIVVAQGEVTLAESPGFHQELVDLCESAPGRLIIDLTNVAYMDSSGVGSLVDIYRKVRARGGKMALVGLTDVVRSLFEITKLDSFFSIYNTQQEALES